MQECSTPCFNANTVSWQPPRFGNQETKPMPKYEGCWVANAAVTWAEFQSNYKLAIRTHRGALTSLK